MAFASSSRGLTLCTDADGSVDPLMRRMQFLAAKNKYSTRADEWSALGISLADPGRPAYVHTFLDGPWEQDDDMDELAAATLRNLGDRDPGSWPPDRPA